MWRSAHLSSSLRLRGPDRTRFRRRQWPGGDPISACAPKCPEHLSGPPAALWADTVATFDLEAHQLALLEAGCDAYARMIHARSTVLEVGPIMLDGKGTPKAPRPGLRRCSSPIPNSTRRTARLASTSATSFHRTFTPHRSAESDRDPLPARDAARTLVSTTQHGTVPDRWRLRPATAHGIRERRQWLRPDDPRHRSRPR